MSIKFSAYTSENPDNLLKFLSYEKAELQANEVFIAITHCGVCRSDWHFMHNDWGDTQYPFIPGHEIVGHVVQQGSAVTGFSLNQRVGVSWQVGACLQCEWCKKGREEFCHDIQGIGINANGGFADHMIVDHQFLHALPDGIDSAHVAPLLCAGATAFNGLKNFPLQPGMRVGILGVGGVGHLAVQFAKAMGCEVTAFIKNSQSVKDMQRLGADEVVYTDDVAALTTLKDQLDFILCTIDTDINYQLYINMLRSLGQLCFIGIPLKSIEVSVFSLIIGQKTISAVPLGSRQHIQDMLRFSAEHQIKPWVEVMPMSQVNEALAKLMEEKAHYRIVLEN